MKEVTGFLSAALPWICIGLLLALFFAQNENKANNKKKETYSTEGLSLGMCFGVAIGTSIGHNTGIGLALGMLAGFVFGSFFEKDQNDGEK